MPPTLIENEKEFTVYKRDLDKAGKYEHRHTGTPESYPCLVLSDWYDDPNGPYCYEHTFIYTQDASKLISSCLLEWRGIPKEDCCTKCQGNGSQVYANTTTWKGGIGGQMMTSGVCDKCWGSGNQNKPWVSLKTLQNKMSFYSGRLDTLQKYQKKLPEPYRTEICNILANGREVI